MRDRQVYPLDHASHLPILIGIAAKFKIRRVLEFGAGSYSTPLFLNRAIFPDLVELVSVERDCEWTAKIKELCQDSRIELTEHDPTSLDKFDLIFIDSAYAIWRIEALRDLANRKELKSLVVIHDSEYPPYRLEFPQFQHSLDFTAYNPETSVVWNMGSEETLNALSQIDRIVSVNADALGVDDVPSWSKILKDDEKRMLTVSVVMTPYDRASLLRNTFQTYLTQTRKPDHIVVVEDGYDAGKTMGVCTEAKEWGLPVEYFSRGNRPNIGFSNSAIPRNIGIKRATGDILVLQNGEVRFTKPTDFENIVGPTEADAAIACCAPVEALDEYGNHKLWYCDPQLTNYNHFCQAYRREAILAIGGFDEAFRGYGFEDHDFNWRMMDYGVFPKWAENVIMQHQWHTVNPDPKDQENEKFNLEYGGQAMREVRSGLRPLAANIGRNWGDINS